MIKLLPIIALLVCCSNPVEVVYIPEEETYKTIWEKEILLFENCDTLKHSYSIDEYTFHPNYEKDEYDFLISYYESNEGNAFYTINGDPSFVSTMLKCNGLDPTYPLIIINQLKDKLSRCEYDTN